MAQATTILWFRQDLRRADNPALQAAIQRGGALIPVFIWAPDEEGDWPPGAASKWWLHQSLRALGEDFAQLGSRLVVRQGDTAAELARLIQETNATALFWNRRYEPAIIARDMQIKERFRGAGIDVESFNSHLLFEPWTIQNKSGRPFQVFSPFWKTCLLHASKGQIAPPVSAPRTMPAPSKWPESLPLQQLDLEPKRDWTSGLKATWKPGERGAKEHWQRFLRDGFHGYAEGRNVPAATGTSRLSPHLHFGEISPRQIWHQLQKEDNASNSGWMNSQFCAELGWREFAHHLLFHFPRTPLEPLRANFNSFPWRADANGLKAWQIGQTGYPIVDAGMRELWRTGWMHNRARMIVASFLVKDLLLSWQEGARWFWDTLVDADLVNNTLGWQWTAGCGADAAPFFRIFNPVTQGERFDGDGTYVRRWVPELARLPGRWLHRPWEAPAPILTQAGVTLGSSYPERLVNHTIAREVAMEAYQRCK